MTTLAVLTVWTLDNHNFDPVERDKLLTEEVVPAAIPDHPHPQRRAPTPRPHPP
jgi:hypothetical protein